MTLPAKKEQANVRRKKNSKDTVEFREGIQHMALRADTDKWKVWNMDAATYCTTVVYFTKLVYIDEPLHKRLPYDCIQINNITVFQILETLGQYESDN